MAKISFEIDDGDFDRKLKVFAKAEDLIICLWEYDQSLRGKIKYGGKEELQPARDLLYEMMRELSIDFDDLM
jgi:hypothetical protein